MKSKTIQKIAFIFPGQGSQSVGMLSALATDYPLIQETFTEASEALNFDLWKLSQQGPKEILDQTRYTQPALLAASVALWRIWQQQVNKVLPLYMAGHSLGEYSALVCAGSLAFAEAIRLVSERGRLMQEAVPVGQGAMAAIIGLEKEKLQALCDSLSQGEVLAPANYNSLEQIVVTGHRQAVDRLVERARQAGAKLAKHIPVSVPSHCLLMKPAAERLSHRLKTVCLFPPQYPLINNADVMMEKQPESIKNALVKQLFNPVRWVEVIQWLERQKIDAFIECGPGRVLAGLNKHITTIPTFLLQDPQVLQGTLTI